ncbi:NAD(P)/FAD-dependent oxidoreductase [Desulfosediminicola flagellatus]|uniref:NAD(P)/FAD-dependent oxidoreductase n=1 Tax=Desulfosediminicola flagellatus TaxID=2569541 RepID=UPI0010ABEA03|nr:NAD(P)/FAD-dependent oxidoreductase [Desulfosediminicola flagellatus]
MGFREITLQLPTDYSDDVLKADIAKQLGIREFSWQIEGKSLDARKKSNIHWLMRVGVLSDELKGGEPNSYPSLEIPWKQRSTKAVVVGSGPAGFFAALILQKAGFQTILIERGSKVARRIDSIQKFESTGAFDPINNYAFGEGGAGTFSDGKLTSRTKKIAREKQFILSSYVRAGGPKEIEYLAHPHLGTDNLRRIVLNLRNEFEDLGGEMRFETELTDLRIDSGKVVAAVTSAGEIPADVVVIAPGHSAHETYRMLINNNVQFRTKNFAIGCRIEHPQELINTAQWGKAELPGVKAAEYRLTAKGDGCLPVYTFCMCPGGIVVPAAAYENTNIVNGMSRYKRNGRFANAACVAGCNLNSLLGRAVEPLEALDWLGDLEQKFYEYSNGYQAPFSTISGFINKREPSQSVESSYPLGLISAPLWDLLPGEISRSVSLGLAQFNKKLRGFGSGTILGLESKTSSPVQVLRDDERRCQGFSNLYLAGEGSGWSGGIISSGVDGIRTAMAIIQQAS